METVKAKVCIIGAGSAGMGAGYALRDLKDELVIIEKYDKLGGTAVNAWVETWINGINLPYLLELFEDLIKQGYTSPEEVESSWLGKKFNKNKMSSDSIYIPRCLLAEKYHEDMTTAGVRIFNNHVFKSASSKIDDKTKKKIVSSIQVEGKSGFKTIEADYFIDCSGSGILCRSIGIDYLYGEDCKTAFEHEESLAPSNPNKDNMNEPSLFYKVGKGGMEREEVLNLNMDLIPSEVTTDGYIEDYNGDKSPYWLNPMTGFGGAEMGKEALNDEDKLYGIFSGETQYKHWALVKKMINEHKNEDTCEGYCPKRQKDYVHQGEYAPMLGIRESYRIRCEYMLTQTDLTTLISSKELKDYIACGSHTVDMHITGNICKCAIEKFNENDLRPGGIPFNCIRPVNLANVLIACKAFGASHIALACRRTNKDMAQLGWAAGHATALCIENNLSDYEDIAKTKIIELQERIKLKESVEKMESLLEDKWKVH
jgi:hypothetical protein